MDKLSRLFVRRLGQIARREARRRAQLNGLLEMKIIGIGGHAVRRYTPAFDTSHLTGDREGDLVWLRRNFRSYLQAPLMPSYKPPRKGSREAGDRTVTQQALSLPALAWPAVVGGPGNRQGIGNGRSASTNANAIAGAGTLSAYAVRLIGEAGTPPLVANIAAALVLARAVEASSVPLGRMLRIVSRSAPVVSLHAPIIGFERAVLRLIETPGFIPGSATPNGVDGDYVFNDQTFDVTEEVGRIFVQFVGENVHRLTGSGLKLRLLNALARDYPVVAIAEKRKHIPDEILMTADVDLATGWLDYPFVSSMIEALYGVEASAVLDTWLNAYDAHHLTLDDVILAFRPGRDAFEAVAVLAKLTERNRLAALDEDDGEGDRPATTGDKATTSKPAATTGSGKPTTTSPADNSRGKRDKPSGAEVIQPEPLPEGNRSGKPVLAVESLSGYGKAKDWALDLKADLGDYRLGELGWSQMSSKLLLSGPPGTGKTTFARALCNSLQLPLVVTSVSTWLQGGHLNDVIDRLSKTFAEARALAPAILFIDEIDGIGKRQPADREYSDYWNAIVNKALELLDGAVRSEGLIIIGATNRPGEIDEALKRSGRLETHNEIPKPDTATLARIFAHHLGDDVEALEKQVAKVGGDGREEGKAGKGGEGEPHEAKVSSVEDALEREGQDPDSGSKGPRADPVQSGSYPAALK
nr:ATP-binding protein [Rhizobium sp. Khangiran2]